MNFLIIFKIRWVSISLKERNNCSFPARLHEFFLNSGTKGLNSNHEVLLYIQLRSILIFCQQKLSRLFKDKKCKWMNECNGYTYVELTQSTAIIKQVNNNDN